MIRKLTIVSLATFISLSASASCVKPASPQLPDANTAVMAQMIKAKKDVKTYMKQANVYLECVSSDMHHDMMVKNMKKTGDDFNQSIRTYKERVRKS